MARNFIQVAEVWNRIKHDTIIIQSSDNLKKFFYTTDHCQSVIRTWQNLDGTVGGEHKNWWGTNDWVASTTHLPYYIVARVEFPSGVITNREENEKLHLSNYTEIPNPEPQYQPSWVEKFFS